MLFSKKGWGWIIVAAVCSSVAADDVTNAVVDYSPGFKKFYAMGLPDAKDAQYVHLNMYGSHVSYSSMHDMDLKGNAWLVHEDPTNKSTLIVDHARTVRIYDQKVWMKKQREEAEKEGGKSRAYHFYYSSRQKAGTWNSVDLGDDMARTLKYMNEQMGEEDVHSWRFRRGLHGRLFLFAIHAHAQGLTNEANRLCGLLFQHAKDRRKVLMQALDILGDAQYEEAYEQYKETQSAESFMDALSRLVEKFRVGWKRKPAVERLLALMKKQSGMDDIPPLEGEDLDDTDQRMARLLAEEDADEDWRFAYSEPLWILEGSAGSDAEEGASNIVACIKARGVKAVPLLIGLVGDDVLTHFDMTQLRGRHHVYFSMDDFDATDETQVTKIFNAMPRPATRGDIARYLLSKILLTDERRQSELNQLSDAQFADRCRTWWEDYGRKPEKELARMYLEKGGTEQQKSAVRFLLRGGASNDYAQIETFLLETEELLQHTDIAHQYVQMRGPEAAGFAEQYMEIARKALDAKSSGGSHDYHRRNVARVIASMKTLISEETGEEMLKKLLAGDITLKEAGTGFYQKLIRYPQKEMITLVLDAARKADKPELSSGLMYVLMYTPRYRLSQAQMQGEKLDPEDTEPELEWHRPVWKELLKDDRTIWYPASKSGRMKVSDAAAWTIEYVYGQEEAASAHWLYYKLGGGAFDYYRRRAEKRVAGETDLPPFPSLEDVEEERVKALLDQFKKAAPEDAAAQWKALPLDEQLAVIGWSEAVEDGALKHIAPIAHRLNGVTRLPEDADIRLDGIQPSDTLNRSMIEKAVAFCKEQALENDHIAVCVFQRLHGLQGVVLHCRILPLDDPGASSWLAWVNNEGRAGKASAMGLVEASGLGARIVWPLDAESGAQNEDAEADDDADETDDLLDDMLGELEYEAEESERKQEEQFWENVDRFCDGEGNLFDSGNIQLIGIPRHEPQTNTASSAYSIY